MAKVQESHSDMAHARQTDGISVIFDQKSPASSRSRSRSRGSNDSGSTRHRGRGGHRRRQRSSSSSSRSRSSSNPRSRSHPRCHRRSSRCRCDNHRRYGRGRYRRSPPRRNRVRSHSHSCSPSPDRYSRHSKSSSRQSRHRRADSRLRVRPSRSPPRTHVSRSRSRSSEHSASLSLDDKRELLEAAKANAMKILGVEKPDLPKTVKPILTEQSESTRASPEPEMRSSEVDPDDIPSPKMSPKRKTISFSINNSVVKPAMAAPSCAKVTPRVDIYESRKPYGHWVRVKSGHTSKARKHTLATSH